MDAALLAIPRAALEVASRSPSPWSGYDFATLPLLVYRVGRWSILVNPPGTAPVGDWEPYPEEWPELSRPAWLDPDGDPGLVGQLSFDTEVPGGLAVAVPLYEDLPEEQRPRDLYLFSFLVHEAFHQFQRHRFSDVETPPEERYPMLDAENNALAGMELRALKEAVEAIGRGDTAAMGEAAVLALAVHEVRWAALEEGARAIERSQEVVEGTAKYVETRWVGDLGEVCRTETRGGIGRLCTSAAGVDEVTWLADDFDARMTEGAIAPEDMARNRIYPAAASVGFLLDHYEGDWKNVVEQEGTERGLFQHLASALAVPPEDRVGLVDEARARYGWPTVLQASQRLVRAYLDGFEEAWTEFEAEAGRRIVVRVPTHGTTRSRSSRERRWVVDEGQRTLGRFVVYALRRRDAPPLELNLENMVVLDDASGEGFRTVTFHAPHDPVVTVDGSTVQLDALGRRTFHSVTLETDGATFTTELGGTLTISADEVRIEVDTAGSAPSAAPPAGTLRAPEH